MINEEIFKMLKNCFDERGRVIQYPTKHRKQIRVLWYIASKLDREKRYTEQEINHFLDEWCLSCDHCTIRRELWNYHFLERERDGSLYWLGQEASFPMLDK